MSSIDYTSYDQESSCSSSITVPDSSRSWMSLNLNLSTLSLSRRTSFSTTASSPSAASAKPHKAQQAAWEAMRGLRRQAAGGRVGLEHFRILKRVGGGDLGNVYLCQIRGASGAGTGTGPAPGAPPPTPCYYAMKVVDREALAIRKKLGRAEMEKDILGMLDHPFLPTLYAEFEASHYSCLVMEFCSGGDLYALRLRQPLRRFSIASAKFYAAETLLALEYLHMMGIIYRDLKPENVLVREDGHIMLSDFDLSLKCDVVPKLLKQKCGDKNNNNHNNNNTSSNNNNTYVWCSTPSCTTSPIQPVLSCFSTHNNNNSRKKKKKSVSRTRTTTIRERVNAGRISSDNDDETEEEEEKEDEEGLEEQVFDTELVAEPINARSKSFVGTHEYLAPEVLSGLGHGSAVDWWTFGVFLYEMLYGKTPFKGENNEKTLMNILKQPIMFPRLSLGSAKEYEEMMKVQDLICKLLVKNPKKRIGSLKGSNEIKKHDFFKGVNWALIRSVRPPLVPKEVQNSKIRVNSSNDQGCNNSSVSSNNRSIYHRVGLNMPKVLSKKEREEPYRIPLHHFDYF